MGPEENKILGDWGETIKELREIQWDELGTPTEDAKDLLWLRAWEGMAEFPRQIKLRHSIEIFGLRGTLWGLWFRLRHRKGGKKK